ncbi:MAG: DegV family protein [Coriobacteriales bacterium]|jgi:DegV family protein with EDD domain|nr:DegV family protein [Coriobacteriales bacterium]
MTTKIILSADSTCDLGDKLKDRYHVQYFPLHITLGGRLYTDNVDITPGETFEIYRKTGELPKTSAVNVGEYLERFRQWTQEGFEVIHVNLGSSISSSHENAVQAAKQTGGVHVIDSGNLSSGSGLLVIAAAERIAQGMPAAQVALEVEELREKTHASFIIDTLEFLRAGGRCSTLQELTANLLKIKPCIEVDNRDGSMRLGRKYRGKLESVLLRYTEDKLEEYVGQIDDSRVFITHTPIAAELIELVRDYLREKACFKEILVTDASTTISSHCGPSTLGVLFMTR